MVNESKSNKIKQKRIKLTDKQKKSIIAEYVDCLNYSEVARKYNIAVNSVKRIVNADETMANKVKQKKEENTKDIIKAMDNKSTKVIGLLDKLLGCIDTKCASMDDFTSLRDLSVAYGTLFDKQTKLEEIKLKRKELELREKEMNQDNEFNNSFIEALNNQASEVWGDEDADENKPKED